MTFLHLYYVLVTDKLFKSDNYFKACDRFFIMHLRWRNQTLQFIFYTVAAPIGALVLHLTKDISISSRETSME